MGEPPGSHPIVVIGAGLSGSLLCLALARSGGEVTLVGPSPGSGPFTSATGISYGSMAGWSAGCRWRRLQRLHGPMGWHPSRLLLHRSEGQVAPLSRLAPLLPFSRVDARELASFLPDRLDRVGVRRLTDPVEDLAPGPGGGWRLRLAAGTGSPRGTEIAAGRVVLAAGAACRTLWPDLPQRLRASWAGVLLLSPNPGGNPWLERVRRGWVVQPAGWKRPALERRVDACPGECWIVDAGLAPWGDGAVLGQISLVRAGPQPIPPPDPLPMERRLRQGLASLDPRLADLPATYHQVRVPFCTDGRPLAGPVAGVRNLWVFSGFSGAFAVVPQAAEKLAGALLSDRRSSGQQQP